VQMLANLLEHKRRVKLRHLPAEATRWNF